MTTHEPERIQKAIARAGKYSRRAVENLLLEKRIKVNGELVTLGCKVTETDKITIDDKPIRRVAEPEKIEVIAYNKPLGEICSRTEKPSVFDRLPDFCERWICIGRLDVNTSGLLLFCNQGDLANKLMHPSSNLDREYAVRVKGEMTDEIRQRLTKGVMLEDGEARFLDMVDSGGSGINRWFHVVVQEGRNRLVRRLIASQGLEVSRLIRVRFGTVVLGTKIRQKSWVSLSHKEVQTLKEITSSS